MNHSKTAVLAFLWSALIGCNSQTEQQPPAQAADMLGTTPQRAYEAISLLGDTLYPVQLPADMQQRHTLAWQTAQRAYRQDPQDLDHIVQLGRSLTSLQRFQEAIQVYTAGLQHAPEAAVLYHHRGQCYITVRKFQEAIRDLQQGTQLIASPRTTVKPEGQSAADNTEASLPFNLYYHLGVAYYLSGAYGKAAQAYEKSLTHTRDEEETAAAADWLYMTYRRLGEDEIAEKTLDVIKEETDRHDQEGHFERIMMYKGMVAPEALLPADTAKVPASLSPLLMTKAYGVGNYYLADGETAKGQQLLQEVVDSHYWVSLDYIAAEVDLARMK